ncbi:MAG: hypothetical protein ACM3X9_13545 [Bacillota bacterium]
MVGICDRRRNIRLPPRTEETHQYPVLAFGCHREIHGQELIGCWVDIIRNQKNSQEQIKPPLRAVFTFQEER